jgi:hypothetical protein
VEERRIPEQRERGESKEVQRRGVRREEELCRGGGEKDTSAEG